MRRRGALGRCAMHSTDRILSTHVGSLVRPPGFRSILEARRDGGPFDPAEYERALREAVIDVVRLQAEAGIDIVSDGEFGKSIHWAAYVLKRMGGLEYRPTGYFDASPMAQSKDMIEFPDFYPEYMASQGFENEGAGGWHCTGKLEYTGQDELRARHRQHPGRPGRGRRPRRLPARRRAGERRRRRVGREPVRARRRSSSSPSPTCCAWSTRRSSTPG